MLPLFRLWLQTAPVTQLLAAFQLMEILPEAMIETKGTMAALWPQ